MERSRKFLSAIVIFIAMLIFLELFIRIFLIDFDDNGRQFFLEKEVLPFKIIPSDVESKINEYDSQNTSYLQFDSYLGWDIRPNSKSKNGLYQSNSAGLRDIDEIPIKKETQKILVSLYGDSFIHSDDVPFNESLSFYIERECPGHVEVLNLGVPGYANDQAYLKWKNKGDKFNSDIVIIGFQPENCVRNLNIIRTFYSKNTDIFFSKPRFFLDGATLKLVNYPVIDYHLIPNLLSKFSEHPLSNYEFFYEKNNYEDRFLFNSKLISLIITYFTLKEKIKYINQGIFEENDINGEMCFQIINKFYLEASQNSTTYLLHLPFKKNLLFYSNKKKFPYDYLLNKLKNETILIDPTEDLMKIYSKELTTFPAGHYDAKTNREIAKAVCKEIYKIG